MKYFLLGLIRIAFFIPFSIILIIYMAWELIMETGGHDFKKSPSKTFWMWYMGVDGI